MAKNVKVIQATSPILSAQSQLSVKKRRVAAYARVSTEKDEQQNSYEAQIEYYTRYIKGNPEWIFAGIYSDEGITGTSIKRRDGFNKMIEDALAGKIDLIVTKSVSRFARNTVDSLTTVRKLKDKGVKFTLRRKTYILVLPRVSFCLPSWLLLRNPRQSVCPTTSNGASVKGMEKE